MSIRRVVSNIGVFCTWVHVLTMSLRSLSKLKPFVLFFGMPRREHKLLFGLIIFINVTSNPCPKMRTGLLTVQPLLFYCWIDQWMSCLHFLGCIYCAKGEP